MLKFLAPHLSISANLFFEKKCYISGYSADEVYLATTFKSPFKRKKDPIDLVHSF